MKVSVHWKHGCVRLLPSGPAHLCRTSLPGSLVPSRNGFFPEVLRLPYLSK